ncbi:hypothetical protein BEWA_026270 [Theileria equi strain WA]|uniref:Uncharacterized protein n=1 Tax=Theileria equi strain WA TaxID=1537102 RepID=L0AWZ4_THEEQ|nr:hypothetical protein BEWA_026270 [Theileria equi strain WA]AFZ79778.1 hypothetical protein BEWA_026270 [Theileria equi strain WA]|eukprot:XP_004829444.1 hypothetical protein BEWA_026270 [Theileria equi strain WA]
MAVPPVIIELRNKPPDIGNSTHQYTSIGSQSTQLTGKLLEEKLDELVCEHHNAVTMNLTFHNSKTHNNKSYCCYKHIGDKKVSVTSNKVSCSTHSGSVPFFKHEVNLSSGWRVAAIYYYDSGVGTPRKRITFTGLTLPTGQPVKVTVYALYYGNNQNPVLIYVDYTGKPAVKGWFQKGNDGSISSNDNEEWTQVGLDITLDKLTKPIDCGDSNFKELVELLTKLGCDGLRQCTQKPEALEQQQKSRAVAHADGDSAVGPAPEEKENEREELQKKEEEDAIDGERLKHAGGADTSAVAALQTQLQEGLGLSDWGIENILGAFADDEMKEVQMSEVGSIEQLHRTGPLNRHIYFAGIPLSHSLQSLKYMRQFAKLKSRNTELEQEVEKLNKEIDELHENAQVNFYKFEVALGKAMQIGVACNTLCKTINDHDRISKRKFINLLREKSILRANRKKYSKKYRNLATVIICNRIHKMVVPTIYPVFTAIRHNSRIALPNVPSAPPRIPKIPVTKVVLPAKEEEKVRTILLYIFCRYKNQLRRHYFVDLKA